MAVRFAAVFAVLALQSGCASHLFPQKNTECEGRVQVVNPDEALFVRITEGDACSVRTKASARVYENDAGVLVVEGATEVTVQRATNLEVVFGTEVLVEVEGEDSVISLFGDGVLSLAGAEGELEECTGCEGLVDVPGPFDVTAVESDLWICSRGATGELDRSNITLWSTGDENWSFVGDGTVTAYVTSGVQVSSTAGVVVDRTIASEVVCGDIPSEVEADTDTDPDPGCDENFQLLPFFDPDNVDAREPIRVVENGGTDPVVDIIVERDGVPVQGTVGPGFITNVWEFVPTTPLSPDTEFEVTVVGECSSFSFVMLTSPVGNSVPNSQLVGGVYVIPPDTLLDLPTLPDFAALGIPDIAFKVLGDPPPNQNSLELRFGGADGGLQDECIDTVEQTADFDNPYFDADLGTPLDLDGVYLLNINGGFTQDGSEVLHLFLTLEIPDWFSPNPPALCGPASVNCTPCSDDPFADCVTRVVEATAVREDSVVLEPAFEECFEDTGDWGDTASPSDPF